MIILRQLENCEGEKRERWSYRGTERKIKTKIWQETIQEMALDTNPCSDIKKKQPKTLSWFKSKK